MCVGVESVFLFGYKYMPQDIDRLKWIDEKNNWNDSIKENGP